MTHEFCLRKVTEIKSWGGKKTRHGPHPSKLTVSHTHRHTHTPHDRHPEKKHTSLLPPQPVRGNSLVSRMAFSHWDALQWHRGTEREGGRKWSRRRGSQEEGERESAGEREEGRDRRPFHSRSVFCESLFSCVCVFSFITLSALRPKDHKDVWYHHGDHNNYL